MSWESAKRELEISQKIQECIELSIGSYNNPYILTYSSRYMVNNETDSNATGETTYKGALRTLLAGSPLAFLFSFSF